MITKVPEFNVQSEVWNYSEENSQIRDLDFFREKLRSHFLNCLFDDAAVQNIVQK